MWILQVSGIKKKVVLEGKFRIDGKFKNQEVTCPISTFSLLIAIKFIPLLHFSTLLYSFRAVLLDSIKLIQCREAIYANSSRSILMVASTVDAQIKSHVSGIVFGR